MMRTAALFSGLSALALTACTDFEILLGKDDAEVAAIVGESKTAATPARADRPLFIQGAEILAMDGAPATPGDVLIEDGVIVRVGSDLKAPKGAQIIDAEGLVLMPGLTDMHVHHYADEDGPLYLANGITCLLYTSDAADDMQ